ncbi:hypothetical protein TNCV_4750301 [Trichonephila clavipes]|nr:hypothetical protein TNCV_4750301 [Trichonephila clavipes]
MQMLLKHLNVRVSRSLVPRLYPQYEFEDYPTREHFPGQPRDEACVVYLFLADSKRKKINTIETQFLADTFIVSEIRIFTIMLQICLNNADICAEPQSPFNH